MHYATNELWTQRFKKKEKEKKNPMMDEKKGARIRSSHRLSHEFDHVTEHLLWRVQAPNEVQVLPMLDVAVEDQIGDLCEEDVYIIGVGQGVVASRPEGCRDLHVSDIIEWWGGLQKEVRDEGTC